MKNLNVDYISDLHLSFYLKSGNTGYSIDSIQTFVNENIKPKVNGEILIIAGDISEFVESVVAFLKECAKYYAKVFFVAGNHEYYISSILSKNMKQEFNYNSTNKIAKICELLKDNEDVIFLDRNNSNSGIAIYNGFKIAGDTLWYLPKGLSGWYFYYLYSNNSRLILSDLSKRNNIINLNDDSINWYDSLPNNLDLLVTHIPPINRKNNSCYYCDVNTIKAPIWIYGHDHIEADFIQGNTRFVSNPWGYESKDFKINTLTLKK